jgi:hypothetical protein
MVGVCPIDLWNFSAYNVAMYHIGDTIRPWAGESVSGVIRRVEEDPLEGDFYWCETHTGNWFRIEAALVKFAMVSHTSLTSIRSGIYVRTSGAQQGTTAALDTRASA